MKLPVQFSSKCTAKWSSRKKHSRKWSRPLKSSLRRTCLWRRTTYREALLFSRLILKTQGKSCLTTRTLKILTLVIISCQGLVMILLTGWALWVKVSTRPISTAQLTEWRKTWVKGTANAVNSCKTSNTELVRILTTTWSNPSAPASWKSSLTRSRLPTTATCWTTWTCWRWACLWNTPLWIITGLFTAFNCTWILWRGRSDTSSCYTNNRLFCWVKGNVFWIRESLSSWSWLLST